MTSVEHKSLVPDKLEVRQKLTNFLKNPAKILRQKDKDRDGEDVLSSSVPRASTGRLSGQEFSYTPTPEFPAHQPSLISQPRAIDIRNTEVASTSGQDSCTILKVIPAHRVAKFHKLLAEPVVDLDALRELSWNGIPYDLRPVCWRLLLGYIPPARNRQAQTLARRRREYCEMVPEYYDIPNSERNEDELAALRQVAVDVPRTAPNVPFFHERIIQESLERMLYIWGIRHPASGYVQGMNDLVTPFLAVFLSEHQQHHTQGLIDQWSVDQLSEEVMLEVEADCYWCLCKLIEGIQDHYTYAQPGIQRTVFKIKELVQRATPGLAAHLEDQGVDFIQFAFRWVNCLLVREMPFPLGIRLWDTYLAESSNFSDFLAYISAQFMLVWKDRIYSDEVRQGMEFQDLVLFLQRLPTSDWDGTKLEYVLSEAFVMRDKYKDAQAHLKA